MVGVGGRWSSWWWWLWLWRCVVRGFVDRDEIIGAALLGKAGFFGLLLSDAGKVDN